MPGKRKRSDVEVSGAPCGTTRRDAARVSESAWARAKLPDVTCATTLQERLALFWRARWGHLGAPVALLPLRLVRGHGEHRISGEINSIVYSSPHFSVLWPSGRYHGFCAFFGNTRCKGRLCLSDDEWRAAERLGAEGYCVKASNSYADLAIALDDYMMGLGGRYACDCGRRFDSEAALKGHFRARGIPV